MRFTCEVMVLSSSTTLAASISCWRLRTCPGWRASACTIQNSVSDSSTTRPSHCACMRSASSVRRSEEHTSELQSQSNLVCRLLLEKKKKEETSFQMRQSREWNNTG